VDFGGLFFANLLFSKMHAKSIGFLFNNIRSLNHKKRN